MRRHFANPRVLDAPVVAGWSDFVTLVKPRISLMVTLTGAVGYFMGCRGGVDAAGLIHTMVGTFLVSGAANTLNQVMERTPDALMRRTANRPLPAKRMDPAHAVAFATVLGVGGILYCALLLNLLTAVIAFATMAAYAFVYTPLKRRTTLNTLVGAVPGALPPLGGWAAATGSASAGGWALFLVLFLWQIPHFLAIAWLLRKEYAKAGFRMLPVLDPFGARTGRMMAGFALVLIPASLAPWLMGFAGPVYAVGAGVLSALYAIVSLRAAANLTPLRNRWVFVTSLAYLPALLVLMVVDKIPS